MSLFLIQGLQAGEDGVAMVDQLLQIMWSVLEEAAADKTNQDRDEDVFTGDKEKLMLLLQQVITCLKFIVCFAAVVQIKNQIFIVLLVLCRSV